MNVQVMSVGQCGVDTSQLTRFLRKSFGVQLVSVDTCEEALEALGTGAFQLVLVNRILDADGSVGTDVIRAIKADTRFSSLPLMLVSNYAEAQAEAVALGALMGFGKGDLGRPAAQRALGPVLSPIARA